MSKKIKNILLKLLEESQEQYDDIILLYGGGFKPPTKGHFNVIQKSLSEYSNVNKVIIFVGGKERDNVTQEHSLKIWEIYKKYLPQKLEIKGVSNPLTSIFNFIKDNPKSKIYWVLGAREGNEEDFKDIASRTKTTSKYPNLEIKTIITNIQVSGTAARNAIQISPKKLSPFLPDLLSEEEKTEIFSILKNEGISESFTHNIEYQDELKFWAIYSNIFDYLKKSPDKVYSFLKEKLKGEQLKALNYFYSNYFNENKSTLNENLNNIDYKQKIKDLTLYFLEKYPNLDPLPKVLFKNNDKENATNFHGKTAYYEPTTNTIVLYTEGRHPKDIVRSFSHEMIHHIQNIEGRLNDVYTTNTTEDDNLQNIEKEAYLEGNINFRNWSDSITHTSLNERENVNFYELEKELDELFADLELDINFTNHFKERVIQRNVTKDDIKDLMYKIHQKYGENLQNTPDRHRRVLKHLSRNVDIVAALNEPWNKDDEKDLVLVTTFKKGPEGEAITNPKKDPVYAVKEDNNKKISDPFGLVAYTKELARLNEEEDEYFIYLDMDGVIADFDERFTQLAGITPKEYESEYGIEKFWDFIDIDNKIKFWVGIPIMDGAKKLVSFIENNFKYELLTSPSKLEQSKLGKRLWVKKNVGSLFSKSPKINFKFASIKQNIKPTLNKFDILIDDKKSTIDRWNEKGGTGIFYQSAEQVIKELNKYVKKGI